MRRSVLSTLLLASVVTSALAFAAKAIADGRPQWRGMNRDGLWNETGIVEHIPEEGLPVRWRAKVVWKKELVTEFNGITAGGCEQLIVWTADTITSLDPPTA